MLVFGDIAIL